MARRLTCPRCGTGRIGPVRMATDDVRRFCVPCSVQTGKLVVMTCPAKDRQATRKRQIQNAARRRKKLREQERLYLLTDGTDVREVLRRVRALKVWKSEGATGALRKLWRPDTCDWRGGDPKTVALDLIHRAATIVLRVTGKMGTTANYEALIREAGAEYFDFDVEQVLQVRRAREALLQRPVTMWDTIRIMAVSR